MNRLEIRGVIVPSSYDGEWADDYIKRGIMIPESRVRTMLGAMDQKQGLELYINSPGGSVFAGNEIINTLNEWGKTTGQPIEITIGAMAASMAASMVVNINASKIKAHKNSKIMFHGAWSETVGGAEAHKDNSDLLNKINSDLKTVLVTRFKLSPETVDTWFAEGRAGWLTAQDAMKAGIVSEIIDSDDKAQKISKAASKMLSERGLKIAAAIEQDVVEAEEVKPEVKDESGVSCKEVSNPSAEVNTQVASGIGKEGSAGAGSGVAKADGKAAIEPSSDVVELHDAIDGLNKQNAALKEVVEAANKTVEKLNKEARDWQARYDKAQADNAKAKKDFDVERDQLRQECSQRDSRINALESRLSKFTLGALSVHQEGPVVTDWAGALTACNGDYVKAKTNYPREWKVMFDKANRK